jgi:hypothetical protein
MSGFTSMSNKIITGSGTQQSQPIPQRVPQGALIEPEEYPAQLLMAKRDELRDTITRHETNVKHLESEAVKERDQLHAAQRIHANLVFAIKVLSETAK